MVVHPYSHRVSRVRRYSGYPLSVFSFTYGTLTLCGRLSHAVRLDISDLDAGPNPEDPKTFGLASSAFARHYLRNLGWCLFLVLLRCFSSDGSPHMTILFIMWYLSIAQVCCHIRISPDHRLFAAPRSFSQLVTSFIGSWCQGIPLALLLAWPSFKKSLFEFWFSWIMQVQLEVYFPKLFLPI